MVVRCKRVVAACGMERKEEEDRHEKTDAVKDGIAPLAVELAETGTMGVVVVPFTATFAACMTWAEVPVAGAYHQRVVTPTGKV